jgi:1-deoxy-D-xylulose-5-phosphate synthase
MAAPCAEAARALRSRGIGVTVADPRWIFPVHPTLVHWAARHRLVISVEDGCRTGGVGAAIAQACADAGVTTPVRVLGLPARFIGAGSRSCLLAEHGLSAQAITATALQAIEDAP